MEPGESIADTILREVCGETGIQARIEKLLGVYSNPRHVSVYDDGEVRQQFSVCFLYRATAGEPRPSGESSQVRIVELAETEQLTIHPSIRLRIQHYTENRAEPFIG
jgi:ADP-ribose pyrophosphatase YjhB (NUDIX family)